MAGIQPYSFDLPSGQLLRGEQGELVNDGNRLLSSCIHTAAHPFGDTSILQPFDVGSLDVLNEVVEVVVGATFR